MGTGTSGDGTSLDDGAAHAAVTALEQSAAAVSACAARSGDRVFGVDVAGRNHTTEAAALKDRLARLSAGLRSWSEAASATAAALRSSIDRSVAVDEFSALRVSTPRGDR